MPVIFISQFVEGAWWHKTFHPEFKDKLFSTTLEYLNWTESQLVKSLINPTKIGPYGTHSQRNPAPVPEQS